MPFARINKLRLLLMLIPIYIIATHKYTYSYKKAFQNAQEGILKIHSLKTKTKTIKINNVF